MIVMMWSLEREKSEKIEGENMRGFVVLLCWGFMGKKHRQ